MKYITFGLISVVVIMSLLIINIMSPAEVSDSDSWQRLQKLHIAMIIDEVTDPFWLALSRGVDQAADEAGIYVEKIAIQANNVDQLRTALERAILSDVDGIVLQPIDDPSIVALLARAKDHDIQLLTYENDVYSPEGIPSVGSNNYDIGREAAKLAVEATRGRAQIALYLNTKNSDDPRFKSLKLQGILEVFADYPAMQIAQIYALDFDPFEADRLTRQALVDYPRVNLIICIDERRTPGIAQTIVDLNRVGDVKIIGFGNMAQTIRYVEKGIIHGIVCADGHEIGYTAINHIYQLIADQSTSEYIPTTIYRFNRDTIGEFSKLLDQPSAE